MFGTASTLSSNTYTSTVSSGTNLTPGTSTAYAGYLLRRLRRGRRLPGRDGDEQHDSPVSLPLPALIVDVWGNGAPVEVDDAPSSSVVYTGANWTHSTTQTGNYDTTESWNATAGTYVKFTFTGTQIEWIGPRNTNQGYANVLIDGTQVATDVNTYASTLSNQQVLFVASGLSNASHTIEIYTVGITPPGSSAAYVPVDAFIYGTGTSGETDDAVGSTGVTYSGSGWTHGGTGSTNYDSTESFDQTANDYVQFTFTGTGVEWIAPTYNNGRYASVYLDGTLMTSSANSYVPGYDSHLPTGDLEQRRPRQHLPHAEDRRRLNRALRSSLTEPTSRSTRS